MIIKFNLFEKIDLSDINIKIKFDKEYIDYLVNNLSFNAYKRKNSVKNFRMNEIDGNHTDKKTDIKIKMNNKDIIEGTYKNVDNSINIYINDELIYDVDYKDFNVQKLLEKIVKIYKKHLKDNKWKLK